jgi:hypothetical protein
MARRPVRPSLAAATAARVARDIGTRADGANLRAADHVQPLAVSLMCPELAVSPDGTLVAWDTRAAHAHTGMRMSHAWYQSRLSYPSASTMTSTSSRSGRTTCLHLSETPSPKPPGAHPLPLIPSGTRSRERLAHIRQRLTARGPSSTAHGLFVSISIFSEWWRRRALRLGGRGLPRGKCYDHRHLGSYPRRRHRWPGIEVRLG